MIVCVTMLRQFNVLKKWFNGKSNHTLRITVLGVTRNVEENELRNAIRFAGGIIVFGAAFFISHKNAMRMMDANSVPAPNSFHWKKDDGILLDAPTPPPSPRRVQ